jgi:hypothetical protein
MGYDYGVVMYTRKDIPYELWMHIQGNFKYEDVCGKCISSDLYIDSDDVNLDEADTTMIVVMVVFIKIFMRIIKDHFIKRFF